MQFYQTLSAILDNNWKETSEKLYLAIVPSDRNSLKGKNLFLKPRYFKLVSDKLRIKPDTVPEGKSFTALFVPTNKYVKAIVFINGAKQPEFTLPKTPKGKTFTTMVAAIAGNEWGKVGPVLTTKEGQEEGYDPETGTLTLIHGSKAQELVFETLGMTEDFTLTIGEPIVYGGGKYGNIPKVIVSYRAKLGKRKGTLKTGIVVKEEITTNIIEVVDPKDKSTIDLVEVEVEVQTIGIYHLEELKHTFTHSNGVFKIDKKVVPSAEMSAKIGTNIFKEWC